MYLEVKTCLEVLTSKIEVQGPQGSEAEAAAITNAMRLGGAALGPLQAAKVRLVFASIWHAGAGGHSPPGAAERVGPALPTPPLPATVLTSEMQDVIPLKGVVMQTGNLLTKLISQEDYDKMFKQHRVRCGADMAQAVEPTRVQVSCYVALVRERGRSLWISRSGRRAQTATRRSAPPRG